MISSWVDTKLMVFLVILIPFGAKSQLTIDLPTNKNNAKWKFYESEEGAFKVLVPGPFKLLADTIETDIGGLIYHTFLLQRNPKESDNVVYMVSYCDYPEGTVHSDSIEFLPSFFDTTIEAATESVQGDLVYSNSDFLGAFPGRVWRTDYLGGEAIIKTKAYVVGKRYYAIQVITLKEKNLNASVERFFNSFQLIESENG